QARRRPQGDDAAGRAGPLPQGSARPAVAHGPGADPAVARPQGGSPAAPATGAGRHTPAALPRLLPLACPLLPAPGRHGTARRGTAPGGGPAPGHHGPGPLPPGRTGPGRGRLLGRPTWGCHGPGAQRGATAGGPRTLSAGAAD